MAETESGVEGAGPPSVGVSARTGYAVEAFLKDQRRRTLEARKERFLAQYIPRIEYARSLIGLASQLMEALDATIAELPEKLAGLDPPVMQAALEEAFGATLQGILDAGHRLGDEREAREQLGMMDAPAGAGDGRGVGDVVDSGRKRR